MAMYIKSFRNRVLAICCCVFSVCSPALHGRESQLPGPKNFLLSSVEQQDGLQARQDIKGRISWLSEAPDGFTVRMEIKEVKRDVPGPNQQGPFVPLQPFTATVTLSRQAEVPLTISISKEDRTGNPYLAGVQQRTLYSILDMMLMASLKNELVCSDASQGSRVLVRHAGLVKFNDMEPLPPASVRSSITPESFAVFPTISATTLTGWNLVSSSCDQGRAAFHSRSVDASTDLVTHAVNLTGRLKEPEKDRDMADIPNTIQSMMQSYALEELRIMDGQ
jgi:hypothetical protein